MYFLVSCIFALFLYILDIYVYAYLFSTPPVHPTPMAPSRRPRLWAVCIVMYTGVHVAPSVDSKDTRFAIFVYI